MLEVSYGDPPHQTRNEATSEESTVGLPSESSSLLEDEDAARGVELLRAVPCKTVQGRDITEDERFFMQSWSNQWRSVPLPALFFSKALTAPHPLPNELVFKARDFNAPEGCSSPWWVYMGILARLHLRTEKDSFRLRHIVSVEIAPASVDSADWKMGTLAHSTVVVNQVDWRLSLCCVDHAVYTSERTTTEYDIREDMPPCLHPDDGSVEIRLGLFPTMYTLERIKMKSVSVRPTAGLLNLGATCYLNSLLQTLFHVGAFRAGIFRATVDTDRTKLLTAPAPPLQEEATWRAPLEKISVVDPAEEGGLADPVNSSFQELTANGGLLSALQALFFRMTKAANALDTREVIQAFGWSELEMYEQHDAQELNRLLCDRLETELKGTPEEGLVEALFEGEFEQVIECTDVEFVSRRKETFSDIQLDVKNIPNLIEALKMYTEIEVLEGENLYHAEFHGPQRARKYARFLRFPPVVQFHLKRFTFDPTTLDMVKVYDRFEFPEEVDLSEFAAGSGLYDLCGVLVHQGCVNSGHYYAFTKRPDSPWVKYDDDQVTVVKDVHAVGDNFGGRTIHPWNYFEVISTDSIKRLHSAYVLFYIRRDAMVANFCREPSSPASRMEHLTGDKLLQPVDPADANPLLAKRFALMDYEMEVFNRAQHDLSTFVRVRLHTDESLRQLHPFPNGALATYSPLVTLKVDGGLKTEALWSYIYNGNVGYEYQARGLVPCLYWVDSEPWSSNQETETTKLWPVDLHKNEKEVDMRTACALVKDDRRALFLPFVAIDLIIQPMPVGGSREHQRIAAIQRLTVQTQVSMVKFYDNSSSLWNEHHYRYLGLVDCKSPSLLTSIKRLVSAECPEANLDSMTYESENSRQSRDAAGVGVVVYDERPQRRGVQEAVQDYLEHFARGVCFPTNAEKHSMEEMVYEAYETPVTEPMFRLYFGESSVNAGIPDPLKEPLIPLIPSISPREAEEAAHFTRSVEVQVLDFLRWRGVSTNVAGGYVDEPASPTTKLMSRILVAKVDTRIPLYVFWSWVAWRLGFDKTHMVHVKPTGSSLECAPAMVYDERQFGLHMLDLDHSVDRFRIFFVVYPVPAARLFVAPISAAVVRVANHFGELVAAAFVDLSSDSVPLIDVVSSMAQQQAPQLQDRWPEMDISTLPFSLLHL
ncbi:MAG: hypothetical protein KVP17_001178 [Porospora cf. gigantea B]|uniref:uncharacterized protein n=1 Tax=Porospora cf. gigantea B TaxID=2853592 RepID=UPI003571807B|nr:MAG: hypothetical protein KVP17_001178 [Porospora cf. gigantea B]